MIIGRIQNKDTNEQALLIVLEPANIAALQVGRNIIKPLKEVLPECETELDIVIAFTPDLQYVMEQMMQGKALLEVIEKSLNRPEVFDRPHHEMIRLLKGETDGN